jgi:hypothetical protein
MSVDEGDTVAHHTLGTERLLKVRFADADGYRNPANFLLERRYAWRGYAVSGIASARANQVTLAAYDSGEAIATLSVGLDSEQGLFVDELFGEEVDQLRRDGGKVCEFTRLAVEESLRSKPVLAAIFHIAYISARRVSGFSELVVEVNPRHVHFYMRMLGFTVIGAQRMDPRVRAPAVLLHLDLAHAEREIARVGGQRARAAEGRSLYPYFFSPREESGIELRLRRAN